MSTDAQALTRIEQPPVDLATAEGLGLEDTRIRPTTVLLVQKTTRDEEAIPGKLFDVLTKTNLDSIQVVPLVIKRGRALFPEGGNLGAKPICRSDDGVTPSQWAEFPQADFCARCPKGSWDNYDKKTGKGKPSCQDKWQLLFIMKETGLPRRLTLSGKSLTPFKELLENIKQDYVKAKFKHETPRNLFDYTFTISSMAVTGEKGNYYIAKFSDVKRLSEPGEFGPMFLEYVKSARAAQDDQEAEKQITTDSAVTDALSSVVDDPVEV